MVVRVEVPAADAELAADLLWQAGATAVGESPADGEAGACATVVLTADLERCPAEVAALGWPVHEEVDDGAWQDGWRPYARAVRAGPFLVRPPWVRAPVRPGVVELVLDGARAFGTGSHPSTVLVLEALPELVTPGCSVLDVGCGSGALAVGAGLLGAGRAVGVDIDPAAVEATAHNAAANAVAVDVSLGDAAEIDGVFDVVLANLGAPLVEQLAPVLQDRTAPGGWLVLSGLFGGRQIDLRSIYPLMVQHQERSTDGWRTLVLQRRDEDDPVPAIGAWNERRGSGFVAERFDRVERQANEPVTNASRPPPRRRASVPGTVGGASGPRGAPSPRR